MRKIHKEKRLQWARQYMKVDFTGEIFTDECRASLDGCDGWACGCVAHGRTTPTRFRRQQDGGGVMFWAGLHGHNLIGPFKIDQGLKLIQRPTKSYCRINLCHMLMVRLDKH